MSLHLIIFIYFAIPVLFIIIGTLWDFRNIYKEWVEGKRKRNLTKDLLKSITIDDNRSLFIITALFWPFMLIFGLTLLCVEQIKNINYNFNIFQKFTVKFFAWVEKKLREHDRNKHPEDYI